MKQKIKSPLGRRIGNHTKVAVSFETDLFRKLCRRCEESDKMFSFVVNDLVRCGLLCVEESENDDLKSSEPVAPWPPPLSSA